jgi:hypothetical protein
MKKTRHCGEEFGEDKKIKVLYVLHLFFFQCHEQTRGRRKKKKTK